MELIWTAFFQRTVNMEQNQKIWKNKTQCWMPSRMYRMRKTSRQSLNHQMMEKTIHTGDGAMVVKLYGLKQNNRKERKFTYTKDDYSEVKTMQGDLNKHPQFDHKMTFKYSLCEQIYDTAGTSTTRNILSSATLVLIVDIHVNSLDRWLYTKGNILQTQLANSHVQQGVARKFSCLRLLWKHTGKFMTKLSIIVILARKITVQYFILNNTFRKNMEMVQ